MTDSKHTEKNQKKIEFDINKLKADGKNIEIIENNDIAFIEQNSGIDQKHYLINLFEGSEIKETMIFGKPATVFCMKNGNYYSTPTPYEKIKETLADVGVYLTK